MRAGPLLLASVAAGALLLQQPPEEEPPREVEVEEEEPPEEDTGVVDPCEDFQQPGCVNTGCPEGQVCERGRECVPTLCACDPRTGQSICSLDCGGGTCVDEGAQCEPLACRVLCPFGFVRDERGCEVCQCNPSPRCGCVTDEDCVKVVGGCCPCELGGAEVAIASECLDRLAQCPVPPDQVPCMAVDVCTDKVARCVAGECALQSQI
jgi:hypothetical protein